MKESFQLQVSYSERTSGNIVEELYEAFFLLNNTQTHYRCFLQTFNSPLCYFIHVKLNVNVKESKSACRLMKSHYFIRLY